MLPVATGFCVVGFGARVVGFRVVGFCVVGFGARVVGFCVVGFSVVGFLVVGFGVGVVQGVSSAQLLAAEAGCGSEPELLSQVVGE